MTANHPLFSFNKGSIPSAILSDMDGLLLDTEQLSKISFDAVTKAYGITNGAEIFPRLIGLNKAAHLEIFHAVLPTGIGADAFNRDWMQRYLAMLANEVPVKRGVVAFLDRCRAQDIPMVVVTSSQTAKAEEFLARARLMDYFECVIGGDQVTNGKPHPDIYLTAAAALSVPPADCLALEDSNNGAMAAYHAGAKVVQIPDLAPQSQDAAALNIPVVASLTDLLPQLGWSAD